MGTAGKCGPPAQWIFGSVLICRFRALANKNRGLWRVLGSFFGPWELSCLALVGTLVMGIVWPISRPVRNAGQFSRCAFTELLCGTKDKSFVLAPPELV